MQSNGNLLIGMACTAMLDVQPGDKFEINLEHRQIRLVSVGGKDEDDARSSAGSSTKLLAKLTRLCCCATWLCSGNAFDQSAADDGTISAPFAHLSHLLGSGDSKTDGDRAAVTTFREPTSCPTRSCKDARSPVTPVTLTK